MNPQSQYTRLKTLQSPYLKGVSALSLIAGLLLTSGADAGPSKAKSPGYVIAAFTPDCRELLTDALTDARKRVDCAIFMITDPKVTNAFVRTQRSGAEVHVKYAQSNYAYFERMQAAIEILQDGGVTCTPIEMKGSFAKMHHKFVVIDSKRVLTGSYNFSVTGAESSHENFVLIESRKIAEQFTETFEAIESQD